MKYMTCCYLRQNKQWLMLYRNKKKNDVNQGKWIGVGGKLEQGETAYECAVREIKEETGYQANRLVLQGILYFHYADVEDDKIWVYTCDDFSGEQVLCNEGELAWIDQDKLLDLSLWDGDRIFLKRILENDSRQFCYEMFYDGNSNLLNVLEKEDEVYE